MKPSNHTLFRALALTTGLATTPAFISSASAGTIDSSAFNAVTNGAVSTAGTLDWGYISDGADFGTKGMFDSNLGGSGASYNNTDFGALVSNSGNPISTVESSPGIGNVTLTEGTTGTNTVDGQNNTSNFTFDGNTAFGSYGNLAGSEQDAWTLTLNDLGIGTFTITLYLGHNNNGRVFDMDVTLTDGGGNDSTTTTSTTIGTLGSTVNGYGTEGSAFTYDVTVTTTTADADLSLVFGSVSGGSGGAIFAGYTVVPEPGSLALLGLGGLLVARRRRG